MIGVPYEGEGVRHVADGYLDEEVPGRQREHGQQATCLTAVASHLAVSLSATQMNAFIEIPF